MNYDSMMMPLPMRSPSPDMNVWQPPSSSSGRKKSKEFKEGDKVVLISFNHDYFDPDPDRLPVWGENGKYVAGKIDRVDGDGELYIHWDNGHTESLYLKEVKLELHSKVVKQQQKEGQEIDFSSFEKLILEKEAKEEVISVLKQHKYKKKIFEEWGLGEMIEYGRGMTFMFYGAPGTGKTWAANCIAKSFGKELLIITASEIQTSEPGGANRNIENAFKEATDSGKILFFDECDSLITSRNSVGMILGSEINTLLTQVERFEGILIMATNRIETLDEALERRISLIVEFPEPDYAERKRIWQTLIPSKLPLGKDVNVGKLAEYKLTGGQIKNCLLQAARFAAAAESKTVGKKYFDTALARMNKSKSLMGRGSRFHTEIIKDDMSPTVSRVKKKVKVKEPTKAK